MSLLKPHCQCQHGSTYSVQYERFILYAVRTSIVLTLTVTNVKENHHHHIFAQKTTYSNRKASEQDRQAQCALTSALMVQVQ